MNTFSVLLQAYVKLPHLALGERIAGLLSVHLQDATVRLRHQQGIIWENLPFDKANALASFLIEKGYPSGLVPQNELVQPGNMMLSRKAEIMDSVFVFVDINDNRLSLSDGNVALAQVGWILEEVEVGSACRDKPVATSTLRLKGEGKYRYYGIDRHAPETEPFGWVLNMFSKGSHPDCVRIQGRSFNYSYQGLHEGGWKDRFGRLLSDLSNILSPGKMDEGFILAMATPLKPAQLAEYETPKAMIERARWSLTLKLVGAE